MDAYKADFLIVGDYGCPYYRVNERFRLSGLKLTAPKNKSSCILLIRDIIDILTASAAADKSGESKDFAKPFCCSGCADGRIKFVPAIDRVNPGLQPAASPEAEAGEQRQVWLAIANLRKAFPCFRTMSEEGLRDIIAFTEVGSYKKGEVILQRDEKGRNLYIIVAGKAGVFDAEDFCFVSLGKGEIFGEMSLLSGNPVNATVKAVQQLKALCLRGPDFDDLLARHPSLRMALTRVVTQRLSAKDTPHAGTPVSGLSGRLNEIPAFELFQMLHENAKTGRIELGLSKGQAFMVFRKGEILTARYHDQEGVDAFFDILSETDGWFSFNALRAHDSLPKTPIGAFMKMLMEGLRLIDEKKAAARDSAQPFTTSHSYPSA